MTNQITRVDLLFDKNGYYTDAIFHRNGKPRIYRYPTPSSLKRLFKLGSILRYGISKEATA